MSLTPDTAFISSVVGLTGVYVECVRPGLILPGLIGLGLLTIGVASLRGYGTCTDGLLCLVASLILFAADALLETHSVLGLLGTLLLGFGAFRLVPPPHQIAVLPAVLPAVSFGALTSFVAHRTRRARANKRADL